MRKSLWLLERVKGIEPSSQAWEARILPLNHTRRSSSRYPSHPWIARPYHNLHLKLKLSSLRGFVFSHRAVARRLLMWVLPRSTDLRSEAPRASQAVTAAE